jgi:tRNA threonylcarbamoyladenosine biosynthesis protein TsaB
MLVLALDTCLNACSVAVVRDGVTLAAVSEPMQRGHQERLAPMTQQAMLAASVAFDDVERVGVTVGPGSFTGLRVGLAFAKGLGAALEIPVIGVGALEALAEGLDGDVLAIVDARREQAYVQVFRSGAALDEPANRALADLPEVLHGLAPNLTIVGPGVDLMASHRPQARLLRRDGPDPIAVARLAATRAPGPLTPLYLRAPDARLPA